MNARRIPSSVETRGCHPRALSLPLSKRLPPHDPTAEQLTKIKGHRALEQFAPERLLTGGGDVSLDVTLPLAPASLLILEPTMY